MIIVKPLIVATSVLALATIAIILFVLTVHLAAHSLSEVYALFPSEPSQRYVTFSQIIGTIVALLSVIAAVTTFWISASRSRTAHRKQHTISILLETRLSDRFHTLTQNRRARFPEYYDISFTEWNAARTAKPVDTKKASIAEAKRLNDAADAITALLNYYEFLAVGIHQGDLDEAMLKKTLRGIMCNLVDDCRELISEMRARNPKTYEHLVDLYGNWRIADSTDINGNPNERPIPNGVT